MRRWRCVRGEVDSGAKMAPAQVRWRDGCGYSGVVVAVPPHWSKSESWRGGGRGLRCGVVVG